MREVYRIYVEKRPENAVEALDTLNDLHTQLNMTNVKTLSIVNRYDVQGIDKATLDKAVPTILSEPMVAIFSG